MWFAAALALATLPAFAQNFPATLSNTASISPPANVTNVDTACTSNGGVFSGGVCSSTDTNTLAAVSDLAVTKTVSNATPTVGTNVTFTVTVTNNGPSAAVSTVVSDALPAGYTFVSATPSVGTYTAGTGAWAVGTLASGANATLQIVATVRPAGPYANTATASSSSTDSNPANNSATSTPVPVASADLAVTKTVSNATPTVGSNVTFTVTVNNNGPSAAAGVNVNDQLPAGYTFVSATPSVGTYNAGTGVWAVGALASGANATLQIVATVRATGPYANTATATSTTSDPTPGNNTATSTPVPVASADLAVVKTASSATPAIGTNVTFTITLTNNGPSAAAGVNVNDQLPAGYLFVSATPSVGTYNAGTGVWAVGALANGGSETLQIVATVLPTGPYANTATATSTTGDPTPGNNTSTSTPTPVASADLAVTKTASNATPTVGTNVTFTVTVNNNGPSAAAGVNVTDQLPAGYTFVSATPSVGTYNAGTGVWAVGALASGANATLQIVATVRPTGPYANTATATSTTTDPTPGNNTATNTPVPVASADLAVVKTASSATPVVGTNVTFTITLTNNGPSAAAGVNVNDQLPAGYTFVSATPSVGTYNAGTGVWAVGALAASANATLQIVATVLPTGPYANTATATSTTSDPTPGNNTSTTTPTPVASADLAVTKTASSATPTVGTNVTFTVTVTNNGPSAAAGVNVNDQLPTGYTFVSANPSTGTYNAGTGVWAVGNLTNGASATLTITATVLATGNYANTATATSSTSDPTPGNNTATNTPTPVASADLAVVKTASSATPVVGTNVTFTITLTNNGPSAAAGVNVNDQLPAGYTFVSATPSVGTYNNGTGVWAVGALANGANATLQIVATVLPTGPYANTATATSTTSDPTPGNNTSTSTPTPVASADLAVTKTASNATPTVGTNVTFTVTVTNNGPSGAAGVNVSDQLPSGYTFVSANPSTGTYVAGTGVWAIGTLANGASATLQIVATVRATGSYVNTATATSTTSDPTPGNNTATNTPVPVASADLAVVKTASSATPTVGTNVTFTITLTNNGPSAAAGVNVNDQLPAGYTFVSATPSVGTYNAGTGVWAVGALANGGSETLQIVATVLPTGPYANTATATSTTSDPTPGNNTSTSTPTPVASADLAVTKTASNATPTVGTNVTFTVTVTNNGPSGAAGVNVSDQLPSGYTFVSANPSTGTYVAGTGVWAIGTLANGASATLQIVATVRATGSYVNTATATSTTSDPTPGNNTASNTPTPVASADLAVVKTASSATPTVGTNVTFTITLTNNGPSAAAGVNVNDQLPAGYTFVSATPSVGTYNAGTGVWAVGALANGGSETLQIVATVLPTGPYANTATATSTTSDPTPGNNTSTSTPTPVASADLAVTKTASSATPTVGTNVTFTVTVTNNGPSTAAGVNVNDQLPSGYTFVSANPSTGTYTAGTGVWAIGTMTNGASATLTIVATVRATGSYANTATATSTTSDPTPGNNTATSTPSPTASADLAVVKTASSATPTVGTNVTFTIALSNNGPSDAAAVVVNDPLPSGYTFVSANPSVGTYDNGTGAWTVGALANGANATLDIVATVRATGSYANTATATSTTGDPDSANNSSTNTPTPVASADLAVVKTASNPTPVVGTNVTFTIAVSNNGPSDAAAVVVNDPLPSGYAFVSATPSVGAYNNGTGAWTVGTLANGASATLDITATVLATGNYANTATGTSSTGDPTPGNNTSTNTPTPVASADLAVTKTASSATPTVGTNITFTVTVANNGPSAAAAVVVNDLLPNGYTFVSATPSVGAYNAGTGAWTVGALANGASETLTVVATVRATGNYANTATATSTTSDPTPGNNTATNTPVPVASADLAVVKTASTATPTVGTNITFTIVVSNNGPSDAAGVAVDDALPSGYAFVSATTSTGAYNNGTGVWTVGALANGASETLTVTATVLATGNYANTATATATTGDPTPGNNTSTNTPTPVASADLAVTKTASTATPTVGTNITFTVTVANNGPSAAAAVAVDDLLPSGYTFVSATPSVGTYTSGTGVWAVGTLANGANATLSVVATVLATGNYANTATATSTTGDPNTANNTATSTPTPVASADLAVVKTASSATPVVGTNITFTIVVSNNGPSDAAAVAVNDALPSGYTFVSANASTGTYNNGTGVWTVGTLANGGSATLTVTATVLATGNYANTATATSTTGDPTPGNNTSTSTPTPVASADLAVTKTASTATPTVGTNITFTVTVANNGPSAAAAVAVDDLLPSGYTFVSATPSVGTYNSGTGVWSVGTLANGANATLSVVATVLATGNYANTATATSTTGDPTPGNNTATNTPTPVASADLAVVKTASNPNPTVGTNVTFTIVVSNNGPSAADAVVVNDALPSGYTFVSANPSTGTYNGTAWTVGTLANGASATLTVTATVLATGNYANTATATSTTGDPTPGNNSSTSTPSPVASADLAVTKTVDNAAPPVGSNVTFTIEVSNAGPSAADAVVVNDPLPNGYAFVSATPSVGTYNGTAWNVGNLAAGANATLTVVARVLETGSYANTATATSPTSDPNSGNNTATSTPVPTRNPQMTLAKAQTSYADNDSSGTITIGDVLTYTLTATNTGNVTLHNVVITDSKTTPSSWNCPDMAPTGPSAVCTVTGTYTVVQADAASGNIVNNAGVTSAEITTPVTATTNTPVQRRPIVANNDAGTVANGAAGGTAVANVLSNDTLNGQPATTATVAISQVSTSDPKVTLDPATGAVHVAPGTPKGSYTVEYRICEIADPANCTTATVVVTVDAAPIDAVDDIVATPVNGATGGTNVVNVLGNDTLGGSAVNPADVTVKPNSNGPLTVKADGHVDVAPNTPAGTYTVTYQLCEVLNPANCDTATVTITVSAPAITATDDPAGGTGTTAQNTPVTTNVIANDTLNGAPIDPNLVTITVSTDPANGTTVVNSDGTITYTPRNNFSGDDVYTYTICEKLNPTNCATAKVNVTVQPNKVTANPDTAQTNQQTPVTINVVGNDTVTGAPLDPASVTVVGQPANGTVTCSAGSCTYTPKQFFAGTDSFTYRVCDTSSPTPVCANATVTITVIANAPVLRLVKTSAVREVKIGDLVRYSVSVENVGDSPAVNATLVDIPPAGFTFVDNSLTVDDDNKNGVVISANPLRIGGIDVAIGGKATVSYFLRVGAGVGKGTHKNQVTGYDDKGTKISNDATAEVTMAGDPLLEDSLLVGSVFDDRDGDGWQDPAKATGVRVQGGFAPNAYVAGSTTVDRGEGPVAEPDASAPMLHGIALGRIDGRGSAAMPTREVVVRQTLSELAFTDDFVLTTDEGTTVRMGADGRSTVERTRGDAAKGLTAQDLQVTRQVSQGAAGYVVSYTIRNNGIEERGIPGVRIASVEGLIMETDAYGRYHLEGIEGGNAARGRNFILKVDPATLPPGSVFTTENPRVRRITQGIPTRFDFGVKLPPGEVSGTKSETDVELGEVMFDAGSAKVKESYAPMFGQIAARLRDAGGGSVTVAAQADEEALAFARARAVQAELLKQIEGDPALASKVKVDVVAGTDATLVSLDPAIRLGEVLFDTDQATIKPQYRALISEIAKTLNQQGSGAIGIVGRADKRGASAYNVQLGLRRAKAVFEAIAAELKPEVRQKVRVDITDDTQAPVGVGNR
ncbi:CARDB domain-containing protein [Lysobacter enzymogenes]|uniref:OmpA-like domain-containing protein n=1 Tax=Lysobacter enzymogenes TaxID=69 RepID=A0AAU9AMF6_LYSEN|nr:CARDB domain-containing protein [Lysobacter enzymogenes]BAV96894.1 conserved hypothetical protein [Lysobacter enzymogenes]